MESEAPELTPPEAEAPALTAAEKKRLKKKRQKERKKQRALEEAQNPEGNPTPAPTEAAPPAEGEKKKRKKKKGGARAGPTSQTNPPSVPVSQFFPNNSYPTGHITEYVGPNATRISQSDCIQRDSINEANLASLRQAAEVHRELRRFARGFVRPGLTMTEIAEAIELAGRRMLACEPPSHIASGIAFPTGLSVNNIAAHWTPNGGDRTVLQSSDVLKIDIGTHVNGMVIDAAFTMSWDDKYDPLLQASREATLAAIREAGIDARLRELGNITEEVITSYEIELDGKTIQLQPVRNLNGHSLGPYTIHAGKSVPNGRNMCSESLRMEEGEMYAIETFASTGRGNVNEDLECSHYRLEADTGYAALRSPKARQLLHFIRSNYDTLAFCRRWLDDAGQDKHLLALKSLVDSGLVCPHPPLVDVRGSYISQHEHTLILRPTCKEVLSRGDDD
eukprot:gnl/Trimastix_PCT/1955.p1 GENE.gnl/Trimastix_PCT/1955~~gnl/Trimastix_PCT/1955.p1  ORF type:complete len:459 (+),score=128.05 gnl/Trimastix_PCT/1955:33-1379(+)